MNVFIDGGVPIKSWAVDLEDGAREQIVNVSRLPFIVKHVALMPDAHQGYGMPVGGVFMADGAIVPYAIGVDIGCGVALIETDLGVDGLYVKSIEALLGRIARDIPVGNGPQAQHKEPQTVTPLDVSLSLVAMDAADKARVQLGTLGGGNHFLELQASEDGKVWFMIHSGSRSLGKKICDHWHKVAVALNTQWHSALPHKELAYLPWGTPEADGYWRDMGFALRWAEENRRRMAVKVIGAFEDILGADAALMLDVHHNYAAWENHFGRNGIVHRKGAVRARVGEQVLIPGSMSTGSSLAEGLGNVDSLMTCQHGAGRARSRSATRKMVTRGQLEDQLSQAGVVLVTRHRESVIDESETAYKDIDAVMAASSDLVKPTMRLRPLGVVKG